MNSSLNPRSAEQVEPTVAITVSLDGLEIFTHSAVPVVATCRQAFDLAFGDDKVFVVRTGQRLSDGSVRSTGKEGDYRVEVDINRCFAQLPTRRASDQRLRFGVAPRTSRGEYGVRFFPFCSSVLKLEVSTSGRPIGQLWIRGSSATRLVWSSAQIKVADGAAVERSTAHYEWGWSETILPLGKTELASTSLEVPVRTSGRFLVEALTYPLLAWLGSIAAIWFAAQFGDGKVVAATVAGTWAFGGKQWIESSRAHQVTLLSATYLVASGLAALWGAGILVNGWLSVPIGALLMMFSALVLNVASSFEYAGRIPRIVESSWTWATLRLEARRAKRRRQSGVEGFDHSPD